jgi:hypothetical protein
VRTTPACFLCATDSRDVLHKNQTSAHSEIAAHQIRDSSTGRHRASVSAIGRLSVGELNKALHISRRFGYHAPEFFTTRGGTLTIKEETPWGRAKTSGKKPKRSRQKRWRKKRPRREKKASRITLVTMANERDRPHADPSASASPTKGRTIQ